METKRSNTRETPPTDEPYGQPTGAETPVPVFFGSGPTQIWTQSCQFDALLFGRRSFVRRAPKDWHGRILIDRHGHWVNKFASAHRTNGAKR